MMIKTKKCTKCGQVKEETSLNFKPSKSLKSGYRNECKICEAKYMKEYRKKNRDAIKKQKDIYNKNNEDDLKEKAKQHRELNKERMAEYDKQYYEKNRELRLEQQAEWRYENKEYIKEYKKENAQSIKVCGQKRRARKRRLPHTLTTKEWIETLQEFNNSCGYCGILEEEHIKETNQALQQEHIIPISKYGGYVKENIIPACRSCNSSKVDNDMVEWYCKNQAFDSERLFKIIEFIGNNSDPYDKYFVLRELYGQWKLSINNITINNLKLLKDINKRIGNN